MKTPLSSLVLVTAAAMLPATAAADETCREHQTLPVEGQLRRLSLALRGQVPDVDEYDAVLGMDTVPDAIVDAYVASDAYRRRMRRYHEELLWPNPAGAALTVNGTTLGTAPGSGALYVLDPGGRQREIRGGNGLHTCQDRPQSDLGWRADGLPVCEPRGSDTIYQGSQLVSAPFCEEGWVLVQPYWQAPGAPLVRACALDAQYPAVWQTVDEDLDHDSQIDPDEDIDHDGFLDVGGEEVRCDYLPVQASNHVGCGCGLHLERCMLPAHEPLLWAHMREQLLRLVDDHVRGGRPYSEILTTRRTWMDGPLMHFAAYQAQQVGFGATYNAAHSGDAELPATFDWNDASWVELERGAPHAGILTLPAYTLRFQTNRGRANRFRIAFLGEYFVPPSVYDQESCDPTSPDLTQKCVCNHCHAVLEPAAAYFGPIAERGSGLLTDFAKHCDTLECVKQQPEGLIPGILMRFYVSDYSTVPETYHLQPLAYAADHPDFEEHFDAGPAGLAAVALAPVEGAPYSKLARATTESLFRFLVHREMKLDPRADDNELALLDDLAGEFTETDDFARLVRRIAALDSFRRLP